MAIDSVSGFWRSERATAIFLACVVFSLFFRSHWGFSPGWESDDGCYLSQLGSWIGMHVQGACPFSENFYAPGAPLTWLPAGLLGTVLSSLFGVPKQDWVVPLVSLWSFALWGLSLVQLTRYFEDRKIEFPFMKMGSAFWALLVLLSIPALYYATHRTTMSHSAELFLAISFLRFLEMRSWAVALLCASLLTLTRYNDAPVFLLWIGKLADEPGGLIARVRGLSARMRLIAGAWLALALAGIAWIAFFHGYANQNVLVLFTYFKWGNFLSFWIGADFGTLWTAPWLVTAWLLAVVFWKRLGWCARSAWLWITLEFFLVICWGGNGGDFGYRYLIGCYSGAILIWGELLSAWRNKPVWVRSFQYLTAFNAIFLTYLLISYKTLPGTGAHNPGGGVENPDLLFKLIQAPWVMPNLWKVVWYQQVPLVTFAVSLISTRQAFLEQFGIAGAELSCLAAALLATLLYIALYLIKAWRLR